MKVLAVLIGHRLPKWTAANNAWTGAHKAGWDLSVATANLVDMELAIMSDEDETVAAGELKIRYVRCANPLSSLAPLLPLSAFAQLYDSRIPELIREGEYDLVHLHGVLPPFAAQRIARACRDHGIPYVITSHGFYELSQYAEIKEFGPLKRMVASLVIARPFRRLVKGAAAIFALSDREGDVLADLEVDAERVHVVTNGVGEFYLQSPGPDDLAAARKKFQLGPAPMLLYVGSPNRYKGLDVFLQSLHHVHEPFQVVVAGHLRGGKEEAERQLREAGIGGGAAPKVVFTGAVSNEELRALYHLADLFVYPTRGDTLPAVVVEAMACGLPVVSTTVSGIPFMVSPQQGLLVPPGDVRATAQAVSTLLADSDRRREMGESAKMSVRERFRWSSSAERAVEAYHAVLDRWHARDVAAPPSNR